MDLWDKSLQVADYPAAHSMDTTWFAVDENGEVGFFDTGSEGIIPVPSEMTELLNQPEPASQEDFRNTGCPGIMGLGTLRSFVKEKIDISPLMAWPPESIDSIQPVTKHGIHHVVDQPLLLFRSYNSIPEEMKDYTIYETSHGPLITYIFFKYEDVKRLIDENRLQRIWTRSLDPGIDFEELEDAWNKVGIHLFDSVNDNWTLDPYIPVNTPNQPLTIGDLPKPLRAQAETRRIPNVNFHDREAWHPYESFANGFAYRKNHIYRGADTFTFFPIPNRRRLWNEFEMFYAHHFEERTLFETDFYPIKYGLDEITIKRFCLTDSVGNIAIFNANPFGAYPAVLRSVIASRSWEPTAPWESFLRSYSVSPHAHHLPFDTSDLERLPGEDLINNETGLNVFRNSQFFVLLKTPTPAREYTEHYLRIPNPDSPGLFRVVYDWVTGQGGWPARELFEDFERNNIEKAWSDGWAAHWMEYPFGPITPRRFGFYHYDMSFLYAGPYARISRPTKPANIAQIPEDLIQALNPVHIQDADFSAMAMIQPMEHMECLSDAPFWLDEALTRVQPAPASREPLDDARKSRILRRARAHYQMIAELERK